MAKKKKVVRRKAQKTPVLSRIQGGVKKMQRDAEALLGRARKEAVRLTREQKRVLDRVVGEARRLRGDLEKSVKRTSKNLESRSKRLLTTLEKDIEKRLEPVVNRLVGPSRQEVQSLSRRVRELEQLVKQHSHADTPAAPPPAPSAPPEAISPSVID
jgi:polyhydroxyalkanoate synthesis regulator phasin